MTPLTPKTIALVDRIFPADSQAVQRLLEEDCGQNLPFCENSTPELLERLRFAALRIGNSNMDKLLEAVSLAKQDWRDLLMWAEFGNSLTAHEEWAEQVLHSSLTK
jgi:hypothetical protein